MLWVEQSLAIGSKVWFPYCNKILRAAFACRISRLFCRDITEDHMCRLFNYGFKSSTPEKHHDNSTNLSRYFPLHDSIYYGNHWIDVICKASRRILLGSPWRSSPVLYHAYSGSVSRTSHCVSRGPLNYHRRGGETLKAICFVYTSAINAHSAIAPLLFLS